MLSFISNGAASWLVRGGVIDDEEHELYAFAVYNLLFTTIPIIVFMLISLFWGCGTCSFILVCSVLAMRRYTGGFHAKKPFVCIVISLSSLTLCTLLVQILNNSVLLTGSLLIASIIIWYFSPIDSVNYRIEDYKKRKYKIRARRTLILELSLYLIFLILGLYQYAVCIALGIILAAILLAVCIPGLTK